MEKPEQGWAIPPAWAGSGTVATTRKIALITGITGQDGAYLAEFLLGKGYEVHGVKRRTSLLNTDRIDHLYQAPHVPRRRFVMNDGDMTDSLSLLRVIHDVKPDEISSRLLKNGQYK